jgi:hypothetical protein
VVSERRRPPYRPTWRRTGGYIGELARHYTARVEFHTLSPSQSDSIRSYATTRRSPPRRRHTGRTAPTCVLPGGPRITPKAAVTGSGLPGAWPPCPRMSTRLCRVSTTPASAPGPGPAATHCRRARAQGHDRRAHPGPFRSRYRRVSDDFDGSEHGRSQPVRPLAPSPDPFAGPPCEGPAPGRVRRVSTPRHR